MEIHPNYLENFNSALDWIKKSECKTGGSSAYYSPILGWSKAYPETTGYLIPTLLNSFLITGDKSLEKMALRYGEWLIEIQNENGSWCSGLYPNINSKRSDSIFNTGQILRGLISLWHHTKDYYWLDSSDKALRWLCNDLYNNKLWTKNDYRYNLTPSYYTYVFWPILEAAKVFNNKKIIDLSRSGLYEIVSRVQENGCFNHWSFEPNKNAFTHTIAYTIRGIQESSRILSDKKLSDSVSKTIEKIIRLSELKNGYLSGSFDDNWCTKVNYVCLTGNVQLAKCLMVYEADKNDLRIVNSASKLIDVVCSNQINKFMIPGIRGAVSGSLPLWGKYMKLRYPNWASKYLCDAIISISRRLC